MILQRVESAFDSKININRRVKVGKGGIRYYLQKYLVSLLARHNKERVLTQ